MMRRIPRRIRRRTLPHQMRLRRPLTTSQGRRIRRTRMRPPPIRQRLRRRWTRGNRTPTRPARPAAVPMLQASRRRGLRPNRRPPEPASVSAADAGIGCSGRRSAASTTADARTRQPAMAPSMADGETPGHRTMRPAMALSNRRMAPTLTPRSRRRHLPRTTTRQRPTRPPHLPRTTTRPRKERLRQPPKTIRPPHPTSAQPAQARAPPGLRRSRAARIQREMLGTRRQARSLRRQPGTGRAPRRASSPSPRHESTLTRPPNRQREARRARARPNLSPRRPSQPAPPGLRRSRHPARCRGTRWRCPASTR